MTLRPGFLPHHFLGDEGQPFFLSGKAFGDGPMSSLALCLEAFVCRDLIVGMLGDAFLHEPIAGSVFPRSERLVERVITHGVWTPCSYRSCPSLNLNTISDTDNQCYPCKRIISVYGNNRVSENLNVCATF